MLVLALVTAESPEDAAEVFIRREDAETALLECLRDEPQWAGLLSIVPIELDEQQISPH